MVHGHQVLKKTMKAILEPLSWNYIGEELTIKSRMKNADYEKN